VRGGFNRKLDAELVLLYRDEWYRVVAIRRARQVAMEDQTTRPQNENPNDLVRATAIAEIYREREEFELLAIHYDAIGNKVLRDKYVERAIESTPTDETMFFLRRLQGRMDLVPQAVVKRMLKRFDEIGDGTQIAAFYEGTNQPVKAAREYLQVVTEALEEGNCFTAAYYLGALERLRADLYLIAHNEAKRTKALWWQVRALQELGWAAELSALLRKNKERIEQSDDLELRRLLARDLGDQDLVLELEIKQARTETLRGFAHTIGPDAGDRDEEGNPVRRRR
jgi:hypothetical protein